MTSQSSAKRSSAVGFQHLICCRFFTLSLRKTTMQQSDELVGFINVRPSPKSKLVLAINESSSIAFFIAVKMFMRSPR